MMSEKAALFSEEELSKLGFGCMRFIGREDNTIDIDYTCDMIDRYLAAGGNYFDTSWVYPNNEATLKKALVDRHPRESFFVATKCIAWAHCNGLEDLRKQLKESLDTLGVDYIDVYLMHNLGGNRTVAFDKYEAWEVIDRYFPNDSYSTAALRFTASVPGVKVTLFGMSSIEQVEDNSAAFKSFKAFDENEREGIDAARDILTKVGTIPCTGCEYCAKVCPNSIGISRAITALNYYIAFGDPSSASSCSWPSPSLRSSPSAANKPAPLGADLDSKPGMIFP